MTNHPDTDREPHHAESSTASLLSELQLYGHRPFQDEPDTRPMPDEHQVGTALADIFEYPSGDGHLPRPRGAR